MASRIFETEVLETKDLTPTVKKLKLSLPDDFDFEAGQFVSVMFEDSGKKIVRPYSISSPPSWKGYLELTVKLFENGVASTYLHNRKQGDKMQMMGPLGIFTVKEDAKQGDIVIIATGTGITPFRSLINDLLEKDFNNKIILLKGVRHVNEILFAKEFAELSERHPNLEVHDIVSRPEEPDYQGEKGHVQELVKKYVPEGFSGNFYICGLKAMIDDVTRLLIEMGYPKERIHYEGFN